MSEQSTSPHYSINKLNLRQQIVHLATQRKYFPFTIAFILLVVIALGSLIYTLGNWFQPTTVEGTQLILTENQKDGSTVIHFALDLSSDLGQEINGIQLVSKITTDSNQAVAFVPNSIDGLFPLLNEFESKDSEHLFKFVLLSQIPDPYKIENSRLELGYLIVPNDSAMFRIDFVPSLSKILQFQSGENVLLPPQSYTIN